MYTRATLDIDAIPQWAGLMSLLRPVQSRVRGESKLFQPRRPHRARARDQAAHADHERDGARGDSWERWIGDWRLLRRQEDWNGQARRGAHRRARGERAGVGAHPSQLEVVALSAGPRELERHGRQVSHGYDGH